MTERASGARSLCVPGSTLLRFPVELSTGRATVRRPPPMPGQHSTEILTDLGYAADEIERLRRNGVT